MAQSCAPLPTNTDKIIGLRGRRKTSPCTSFHPQSSCTSSCPSEVMLGSAAHGGRRNLRSGRWHCNVRSGQIVRVKRARSLALLTSRDTVLYRIIPTIKQRNTTITIELIRLNQWMRWRDLSQSQDPWKARESSQGRRYEGNYPSEWPKECLIPVKCMFARAGQDSGDSGFYLPGYTVRIPHWIHPVFS